MIPAMAVASSPARPVSAGSDGYHVSNAGNNANSGLSELLPWQTYAKAMTSAPASATIRGKNGDMFRETVTASQNGFAFASYGTGASGPIINGADVATGWGAAGVGTNTFSVAFASTVRILFAAGVRATLGASQSTLNDGEFFWLSGTLYYRSNAGNPDSIALAIEAGQRDYCINQNSHSGITITGVTCQYSQHTSNGAIYFQGIGAVDAFAVTQCIIKDHYSSGILCHAASVGAIVTYNQFLRCGQHGYWCDTTDEQNGHTASHNTITDCGWRLNGAVNFPSGIIGGFRGSDIGFNTITNQGFGGSGGHAHAIYCGQDLNSGSPNLIHDNLCAGSYNGTGIKTTQDATISFNICRLNTGGGMNPGQNTGTFSCTVVTHHNVIDTNCSIGGAGIDVKNAGSSGTLSYASYHDTFYNNSTAVSGGELLIETLCTTLDIRNAIFYTTSLSSSKYIQSFVAQTGTVTVDYNCYFGTGNTTPFRYNGTSMSLATWKAQAFAPDVHSITSDPLFTNAAGGDFTLQSGSPAKNAGIAIAGISTGTPNMGAM